MGRSSGELWRAKAGLSAEEAGFGQGKRLRALLLQDDPNDADLVIRALAQNGFTVPDNVAETPAKLTQQIRAAS